MIPTLSQFQGHRWFFWVWVGLFLVFLFLPLTVVAVFAFNDANYPTPPWQGFTWDWFFARGPERTGLFYDQELLRAVGVSAWVAAWVTLLTVLVGTCNAFLFERFEFPGKQGLVLLSMVPLVIPGVILGVSILALASRVANWVSDVWGWEWDFLRPGLPLVVAGQFCYIASIATLTISARLRRFDRSWEEAAYNLGASRWSVFWTITLPYLRPSLWGAGAMAFLMSFENFNTTYMLVGSEPPLTVLMFGRMREGSTPIINAVSLVLMLASAAVALLLWWRTPRKSAAGGAG